MSILIYPKPGCRNVINLLLEGGREENNYLILLPFPTQEI